MADIPAGSKVIFYDSTIPFTEKKSTKANAKQEVYTVDDVAKYVTGGSKMGYAEVSIDATALASLGTSPVELLPVAGANSYYIIDWEKSSMEFTTAGAGVVTGTSDHLLIKDTSGYIFRRYADEGMAPSIGNTSIWNLGATPSSFEVDATTNKVISSEFYPNEAIYLQSVNSASSGVNFTSVDTGCVMLVKLYFRIETIGTNL